MPIGFDTETDSFVVIADHCPHCKQPLYDTGCDAEGCPGRCCFDCGTGCDIEFVSAEDGGRCATALAEESGDEYEDRINRERAAFGLSPITANGQ